LCDLPDLFDWGGNMGPFDQEAGYLATHLSGWTKRAVGWLDPSTVALHLGQAAEIHSALNQPHPTAPNRKNSRSADRCSGAVSHGRSTPAGRPI
jgi:hypothetical protein